MAFASASGQEINVLSAGAVEPGLRNALALYSGKVNVTFNTAPQIRERIEKKGEKYDVLVVHLLSWTPSPKPDAWKPSASRSAGGTGPCGAPRRAGAGCVHPRCDEARAPRSGIVVFNRATGGQYIESMLRKIGVYDEIEKKTTRYASAGEVMDHLLKGKGREIGFAPITEIRIYEKKGLNSSGPCPRKCSSTTPTSPQRCAAARTPRRLPS